MSEQLPRYEVEDEYSEYLHKQEDGSWTLYKGAAEFEAQLDALRKGLQGEVDRLRDEAAACRDEATKRRHTVTANLALGEGSAIDRRANRLSALLDADALPKGADDVV